MANFCLPKEIRDRFLGAIHDGSIDPIKLSEMDSAARRSEFEKYVGGSAKEVNTLFESKLLLKNQEQGFITWAKSVGGLKPEAMRDLVTKMSKLEKVLNPEEEKAFLQDLASKKLGVDVTLEETKNISDLTKKAQEDGKTYTDSGNLADRVQYGLSQMKLHDYLESLKPLDKKIVSNVANIPKTIMTALDFSALLRQGWGMMSQPEFYKAIGPMFKYAFSEKGYREMQAEVLTRPTYPIMKAAGLRVAALADKLSQREEAYMTTLTNRIPGIRGSERAYVGFLTRLRADTFDKYLKYAELKGEDVSKGSQTTKDIANVINDFTGSGNIGKGDKYSSSVPALNAGLFSPRKISATINMLNPIRYIDPRISSTARQAALRNIIGSVGITTGLLALAHLFGAKTETDSNSADFGKAVLNKTHADLTGGNGTYAVLLSRLIQNKTKSTTTGKNTILGIGYKPTTRADLITSFARNKLSPIGSFIADWLYGKDAVGVPFNASTELLNRATPLVAQDINDMIKKGGSVASTITGFLADELGIGIQTY